MSEEILSLKKVSTLLTACLPVYRNVNYLPSGASSFAERGPFRLSVTSCSRDTEELVEVVLSIQSGSDQNGVWYRYVPYSAAEYAAIEPMVLVFDFKFDQLMNGRTPRNVFGEDAIRFIKKACAVIPRETSIIALSGICKQVLQTIERLETQQK